VNLRNWGLHSEYEYVVYSQSAVFNNLAEELFLFPGIGALQMELWLLLENILFWQWLVM
jgi:hypothetical protein